MKFKAGDRAIIATSKENDACPHYCKLGSTAKIMRAYDDSYYVVECVSNSHGGIVTQSVREKDLKPFKSEFTPPFYVNCPTEEIWDKVTEKMFEMGGTWCGGDVDFVKCLWNERVLPDKKQTTLTLKKDKEIGYGSPEWFKENGGYGEEINYHDFLGIKKEKVKYAPEAKLEWKNFADGVGLEPKPNYEIEWNPFYKFSKNIMGVLRDIPNRLKRALNANLRKFYQLSWIDGDLDITPEGEEALTNFLFDKYEKELGEVAEVKIRELKKSKKEEVEE